MKYEKDSNGNEIRVESWAFYDSANGTTPFFLNDGSVKDEQTINFKSKRVN